jgi:hypothetical protein
MCIFVTSGGNTAAPGPNLTASNCGIGQLKVPSWMVLCWGMSTFCGIIVSRRIGFIVRLWVPYCSQLPHTPYYAHHLECDLGNGEILRCVQRSFILRSTIILSFRAKRPPVEKSSNLHGDLATTSRFLHFGRKIMSKGVRLAGRAVRQYGVPVADLPVFLCPGLLRFPSVQPKPRPQESRRTLYQASQQRHITSIASKSSGSLPTVLAPLLGILPQQCTGCGALSQTVDKEAPGFYTPTRKSILQYLEGTPTSIKSAEDEIVKAALENAVSVETGINLGDFAASGKHTSFCELNLLLTSVQPKVQSHRFVIDATN